MYILYLYIIAGIDVIALKTEFKTLIECNNVIKSTVVNYGNKSRTSLNMKCEIKK